MKALFQERIRGILGDVVISPFFPDLFHDLRFRGSFHAVRRVNIKFRRILFVAITKRHDGHVVFLEILHEVHDGSDDLLGQFIFHLTFSNETV